MYNLTDGTELWLMTLEHSPVGMTLVDLDGRLLMVNRALCEMLGYSPVELSKRDFQELTHADDLEADLVLFGQALRGEIDSYRIQKRYLHADGHVVWGDLSVALVRGADDEPSHFISQVLDITEQRESEQRLTAAVDELERERQTLEAVFETAGVGLLLIGPDGHFDRMNRRQREIMGVTFPDGHHGRAGQLGYVYQPDGTSPMPEEDLPSVRAQQGEEFDDYTYWVGEDIRTRAAFSTSARQVRGPNGEQIGSALAFQEITELMRAMRVRDEFVSSVSHELRTPLTSVLGHLEMLSERDGLPDDVVGQLQVVRRNATRLLALVSDVLHVSQAEQGTLSLVRSEVDLSELAGEAVEAVRPTATEAGVSITLAAPDTLPVCVDAQRIRQVLDNLLSNAVKYSEPGSDVCVTLRASDAGPADPAGTVEIDVTDTGIGIAPDEIGRVFTRFYRGGAVLESHIPGTGLGLDIVSSILAAHGGAVRVESELGRGSTFLVTLPGSAAARTLPRRRAREVVTPAAC